MDSNIIGQIVGDLSGACLLMLILLFVLAFREAAKKKERIEKAYKWEKPNIHGQRNFASDEELKKAGLL